MVFTFEKSTVSLVVMSIEFLKLIINYLLVYTTNCFSLGWEYIILNT